MKKILILVFILLSCKKNSDKKNFFTLLELNHDRNLKIYFSYPGRFTDEKKKREVIDAILNFIKNSKTSLKFFAYSFNNPEIISALIEARNRNVKIEFLLDSKEKYDLLKENKFSFKIWNSSSLHHLKVILADEKKVFMGTGNFSRNGLVLDNNGYIEFELEKNSERKFLDYLNENYAEPVLYTNQMFFFNSPENGLLIQDQILKEIRNAKSKIQFLTFDHTDSILSHELRQASKRGVEVTGIYDSPVDKEGSYLQDAFYGIRSKIYRDGNEDRIPNSSGFFEGGILHHKTILLDDEKLLTGSYNFSLNARDNNREFFFITKNLFMVSEFRKEFQRIQSNSYMVPKKVFLVEEKNSENLSVNQKEIFVPKINSPILEIDDYFKTRLYFPEAINSNRIQFEDYKEISTGISNSTKKEFLSLNLENAYLKIFDKFSNETYDKPKNNFSFGERIYNPKILHLEFIGFNLNNQILIQAPKGIDLNQAEFQIWIPRTGSFTGSLEIFNQIENQYLIRTEVLESRRNYLAFFFKTKDIDYFTCAKQKNLKEKGKDFLIKKIFTEEFFLNQNLKFKDCYYF